MMLKFHMLVGSLSVALLSATSISAQSSNTGHSQEQRIELARKLLDETRKTAIEDPTSKARLHYFTPHWAAIDPAWTAKFILKNPPPDDGALYDNKALLILMKRPTELDDDNLLKLLRTSNSFVFFTYAQLAIENLPDDQIELCEQINALVRDRIKADEGTNMYQLLGQMSYAKKAADAGLVQQVKDKIELFFSSDKPQQHLDAAIKQEKTGRTFGLVEQTQRTLYQLAPADKKAQYDAADNSLGPRKDFVTILRDLTLTDSEKKEQLRKIEKIQYGKRSHEQIEVVYNLARVASFDMDLALKWAESAPDPAVRIWGRLLVAPLIAKSDKSRANQIIRDCYSGFLKLDGSDKIERNYNHPAANFAGRGLRLVAAVNPDLLDECIDITIETIAPLTQSRHTTAQAQVFDTVAAIARYDAAKAEQLFDEHSDEVSLHSSASFFRALVSLHPEHVFDEYQTIPVATEDGTDWRIHVRNAILPALVQNDTDAFWDFLFGYSQPRIDPALFGK